MVRASNSRGPLWCAPHIEGQYLRDEITKLVMASADWFDSVYDLLTKHQLDSEERKQFYAHAKGVEGRKSEAKQ